MVFRVCVGSEISVAVDGSEVGPLIARFHQFGRVVAVSVDPKATLR